MFTQVGAPHLVGELGQGLSFRGVKLLCKTEASKAVPVLHMPSLRKLHQLPFKLVALSNLTVLNCVVGTPSEFPFRGHPGTASLSEGVVFMQENVASPKYYRRALT